MSYRRSYNALIYCKKVPYGSRPYDSDARPYNFVRQHKTLRVAPAMVAGLSTTLWSMEDVVALIDAAAGPAKARGPYKPRAAKSAISN